MDWNVSSESWDSAWERTTQGKSGFRPAATAEDSKEGHSSEPGGQGHLLPGVRLKGAFILASQNPACA